MRWTRYWTLLLLLLPMTPLSAQTVTVDMVGDGTSRWYDYVSDSFGQLDGGPSFSGFPLRDAFYVIGSLPGFVVQTAGGSTGAVVFANGADFDDIGTLTFDPTGITGTGVEVANVTALSMTFNQYVADDDAVVGTYTESYANVSGTVTLTNGAVTSMDVTADVTFFYDYSFFGVGVLDFPGTLTLSGTSFTLSADKNHVFGGGNPDVRHRWEVTGTTSGVATLGNPVPVFPLWAQLVLTGLFGLILFASARRRTEP